MILGRIDLTLAESDGTFKDVHRYEQYWAPITEGRVSLRDVVTFLKDAGPRGLRQTFQPFVRFMFGRPVMFQKTPFVALPLAACTGRLSRSRCRSTRRLR